MKRLIIGVEGGLVTGFSASEEVEEVDIMDWDAAKEDDEEMVRCKELEREAERLPFKW
jgi:CRISPR/Cas system-associated protein Csm6